VGAWPQAGAAPVAWLLLAIGLLTASSVLLSRFSGRLGVPLQLLFLLVGVGAGAALRAGHGDYGRAVRIGTAALVVILFDGGLNTAASSLERALVPAAVLATVGVAGTAALTAIGAHGFGFAWGEALLLGAIASSTDAASVFAVLRGSGLQLRRRVAATLELESGLNDPMAAILTLGLTRALAAGRSVDARLLLAVPYPLAIGLALGAVFGLGGRVVLRRAHLPAGGLYPVLALALAFTAFGAATLVGGSGFLAVYVAGLFVGNGPLPYRSGLLRSHDALAWIAQVAMFLLLGLLVAPSQVLRAAPAGLSVGLLLACFARPIVVALCLAPFRYPPREIAFVGWLGLRGAVPIILAAFPVLAGVAGAQRVFDVIFFVVLVNAFVPGGTVRWATRRLGVESSRPPLPAASIEVHSTRMIRSELLAFYIDRASAACGAALEDLPLPEGAGAMLILRGDELLPSRPGATLAAGDHLYVFCRPEDRAFVQLLFGRPDED